MFGRALVVLALLSFASPAFSQADDAMLPKTCVEQRRNTLEFIERALPLPPRDEFAVFEAAIRLSLAVTDTECVRAACRLDVRNCHKVHLLEVIERKLRDHFLSLR